MINCNKVGEVLIKIIMTIQADFITHNNNFVAISFAQLSDDGIDDFKLLINGSNCSAELFANLVNVYSIQLRQWGVSDDSRHSTLCRLLKYLRLHLFVINGFKLINIISGSNDPTDEIVDYSYLNETHKKYSPDNQPSEVIITNKSQQQDFRRFY